MTWLRVNWALVACSVLPSLAHVGNGTRVAADVPEHPAMLRADDEDQDEQAIMGSAHVSASQRGRPHGAMAVSTRTGLSTSGLPPILRSPAIPAANGAGRDRSSSPQPLLQVTRRSLQRSGGAPLVPPVRDGHMPYWPVPGGTHAERGDGALSLTAPSTAVPVGSVRRRAAWWSSGLARAPGCSPCSPSCLSCGRSPGSPTPTTRATSISTRGGSCASRRRCGTRRWGSGPSPTSRSATCSPWARSSGPSTPWASRCG